MIVVDTSVWISFLRKDDLELADILRSYLKRNDVYAVSAIFGELFQGVKNRRERELIQVWWESLPKLNELDLFIRAGHLSNDYKLFDKGVGLIDCYILSACEQNHLALWTLDKKLQQAYETMLGTE
jgi:predicted nucleic acid-binding protein